MPTVGRQVHYVPHVNDMRPGFIYILDATREQPPVCAATITYVHHDTKVNLSVFDHAGRHYAIQDVELIAENMYPPLNERYCMWPVIHKPNTPHLQEMAVDNGAS